MSKFDLPLEALKFQLASELVKQGVREFVGEVLDIVVKKDRHGRPTLQLHVYSQEHGRIVITLSPSYTNLAVENLSKLGFTKLSEILGHRFKFELVKLDKVRNDYTDPYPRYIPVARVD